MFMVRLVARAMCLFAVVLPVAAQNYSIDFRDDPVVTAERYGSFARLVATGQTVTYGLTVDYSYTVGGATITGSTHLWGTGGQFHVPVPNDDLHTGELTGTITISYHHPYTNQVVTKSAGLVVEDEEGTPGALFDDVRVMESDRGTHAMTLRLSHRSVFPTVVALQTCCGTATAGTDFELIDTSVTIPPMQTAGEVRFLVFPDREAEGAETFRILQGWGIHGTVTIVEEDLQVVVSPPMPRVPAGERFDLELSLPDGAPGPVGAALEIANQGIVSFVGADDLLVENTPKVIPLLAGMPGYTTFTVEPGSALFSSTVVGIEVYDVGFDVEPFPQPLGVGEELPVTVRMNPPGTPFELSVHVAPAGIIDTASTLYFGAGGATTLAIKALKAGTADIRLITPSGKLVSYFDVKVAESMAVRSVAPDSGPAAGGTSVTIAGAAFAGTCTVKFGNVPATSVTRIDETTLRAVTPNHPHGRVGVTVTCSGSTHTLPQSFTFNQPGRSRSVRH